MLIGNTQPDGTGSRIIQVLSAEGEVKTSPDAALSEAWIPDVLGDTGTNAAEFTVPDGFKYKIQSILVTYVSATTAGNRRLEVQILDTDLTTIVARSRVGIDQAVTITRIFSFAPGFTPGASSFVDTNFVECHIPEWEVPEGCVIKIVDVNNITAANDTITAYLFLKRQNMSF